MLNLNLSKKVENATHLTSIEEGSGERAMVRIGRRDDIIAYPSVSNQTHGSKPG